MVGAMFWYLDVLVSLDTLLAMLIRLFFCFVIETYVLGEVSRIGRWCVKSFFFEQALFLCYSV